MPPTGHIMPAAGQGEGAKDHVARTATDGSGTGPHPMPGETHPTDVAHPPRRRSSPPNQDAEREPQHQARAPHHYQARPEREIVSSDAEKSRT
jgi:hypothetical protein